MIGILRDQEMSIGIRKFGRQIHSVRHKSSDGHSEYQEDTKWYELVEEVDRELLDGWQTKGWWRGPDDDRR